MSDCAACGSRLEEGITKCPQCGADLKMPGGFTQVLGWVTFFFSSIPIVVGVLASQQKSYTALGIGIAVCVAGIILIVAGRLKSTTSPSPTKPSPSPLVAQPPGAPAK